jgi:hypothetical protein
MPQALDWLATARECFADDYGSLQQGLLTSIFSLVVGLERVFHLQDMDDLGFARLCGGRRCPSRYTVGAWRRHLPWYEVDAFCRRTCPWHLLRHEHAMVSFDEHTIPRWTRKFHIGKGYVTTRNKYMRCEKLFTGYDLVSGRFLSVRATPGNWNLQDLAVPLARAYASPLVQDTIAAENFFEEIRVQSGSEAFLGNAQLLRVRLQQG